ncbi:MAG: hypothetical protein FJW31_21780 [Acidobacteria bacterium]|nr:hypothetical protein [Acidobacteriota bacterium]
MPETHEASRTNSTGAFAFGGGVDVRVWRWIRLRFEARDFLTGRPAYNVSVPGRQHNVVISAGFVISALR